MKFSRVIKSMTKASGSSIDKVNLAEFIELINDSLIFNTSKTNPGNYPLSCWLGVIIQKNPLDLMILQEIMFETRPNTVIECGTGDGGSAYYMATLMDLMNIDGKIITIDHLEHPPVEAHPKKDLVTIDGKIVAVDIDLYQARIRPKHSKIEYMYSDCLTAAIPKLGTRTMIVLDCNHATDHVYAELQKYSSMVTVGQYLIVEDTVLVDKNNSPANAIKKFLRKNKHFVVDKAREKFGISSNLGGYLLRIS